MKRAASKCPCFNPLRSVRSSAAGRPGTAGLLVTVLASLLLSACKQPGADLKNETQVPVRSGLVLDVAKTGKRLVSVGEYGRIAYSDDHAKSWQQADSPTRALLTAAGFADAKQGWAVGHGPLILRTDDGGATWAKQTVATDAIDPLFDIQPVSATQGVAVGAFGQIWRTEDGGATWTQVMLSEQGNGELSEEVNATGVPVVESHLYSITCVPKAPCRSLFAAGEGGTILRSGDLGKTWQVVDTQANTTFFGISASGNRLIAYGMFGEAIASSNGGRSWSLLSTGTDRSFLAGTWLPDGTAVLVGNDGTMLRYHPLGNKVRAMKYPSPDMLTSIMPLDNEHLLLANGAGTVRLSMP